MCVHRLYIFLDCGHTTYAPSPLRLCAAAARAQHPSNAPYPDAEEQLKPQVHTQIRSPSDSPPKDHPRPRTSPYSLPLAPPSSKPTPSPPQLTTPPPCPPTAHPYHTLALHKTCLPCQRHRAALLAALEDEAPGVRVEGWKWRVKYVPRGREDAYPASEMGDGGMGETMGEAMGSWVKGWGAHGRKGEVGRVGYGGGR